MAPEMLTHKVSEDQLFKVDVYSFGIIMYETFFEKLPFQGENNQMDSIVTLGMRVVNNERPFVPDINVSAAEKLYLETMKACWSANPVDRPTFTDVFSQFEEILSMSN
jgi:serine/threonine protein kinase